MKTLLAILKALPPEKLTKPEHDPVLFCGNGNFHSWSGYYGTVKCELCGIWIKKRVDE